MQTITKGRDPVSKRNALIAADRSGLSFKNIREAYRYGLTGMVAAVAIGAFAVFAMNN